MIGTTNRYVCAFRGRRDSYQVPLALAEADLLDQFITDAYAVPWLTAVTGLAPQSVRPKIDARSEPGIPIKRVRCLWGATIIEHVRHRLGFAPMTTYNKLDREFSRAACRRAQQTGSNLFLYSPYAWEAFTATYSHKPRKVLFQYHPHPDFEAEILKQDSKNYPGIGESFSGTKFGQAKENFRQRERDVWKHADLILCASTFTKQSLIQAGCEEGKCRVVPYGVGLCGTGPRSVPANFQVLFVGSGGQRKGLHHLLLAWQRATLPENSKLVLVCRVVDRGIEEVIAKTPRVELHRNVTPEQLRELYAQSALFAMPSLVEGFGEVYLEALAEGCPVLGTANTGLPDIGQETDGVFLVTPGDVAELTAKLKALASYLRHNHEMRNAAKNLAGRFTWDSFRHGVREGLSRRSM